MREAKRITLLEQVITQVTGFEELQNWDGILMNVMIALTSTPREFFFIQKKVYWKRTACHGFTSLTTLPFVIFDYGDYFKKSVIFAVIQ